MHKLDVVTFSWQKVLGGEAAHGMLILSPRAVERLQSYTPPWPVPKIFRMTNGGKLNEALFEGETINTPSMICVEDCLDALEWANSIGGLAVMLQRADANLAAIEAWVERTPWAQFLARDQRTRSNTSVCVTIADPAITQLSIDAQRDVIKAMATALERGERRLRHRRPCSRGAAAPAHLGRLYGGNRRSGGAVSLARLGFCGCQGCNCEGGVRETSERTASHFVSTPSARWSATGYQIAGARSKSLATPY